MLTYLFICGIIAVIALSTLLGKMWYEDLVEVLLDTNVIVYYLIYLITGFLTIVVTVSLVSGLILVLLDLLYLIINSSQ